MAAKTNFELIKSARAAAEKLLGTDTNHALATEALKAFNDDNQHPLDWDQWHHEFSQAFQNFTGLQKQPTKSAAAEAAKVKAGPGISAGPSSSEPAK